MNSYGQEKNVVLPPMNFSRTEMAIPAEMDT
jgi:hypothetical protein